MARAAMFLYSLGAYGLFLGVFLYLVAFVGNLFVPRSIDVGPAADPLRAFAIDLGLIALFGLQHSVMARPAFKRWVTQWLPAPVERSTFVLAGSLVLALLFWQWRPIPAILWHAEGGVAWLLWSVFALGWATVLLSTFLINHFDLFGLRQSWMNLRGRPLKPLVFRTTLLYRLVRHPIMLGFLLAFWFTPSMSAGHLLFAIGMTGYILVGVHCEERDLVRSLGQDYVDYRRTTPAFVPGLPGASADLPVRPDRSPVHAGR